MAAASPDAIDAATLVIDQASEAAKKFAEVYYRTMDKTRHLVGKLYTDSANLVWNGNSIAGQEAIVKFYTDLPASDHRVEALDSQPIPGFATAEQSTIVVTAAGMVRYSRNKERMFSQTFMLMSQGTQPWKIISDSVRMVDAEPPV